MSDRKGLLWLVGLFVAGVGYGLLGSGLSLDWIDEGQLVYLSWRVAEGALPYRDFQNIYGPSVFLLNGSLFRWFGEDLWVIRVALSLLKGLLAVVVYLCTLRLGPRPIALGAWLLCIVVWGLPWPYFTTPYANFYGLSLSMGGILALATLRGTDRVSLGYFFAGLCFGVAATFKQTNGLFAYCAVMLHLVSLRSAPADAPPVSGKRLALRIPGPVLGASRWIVLGAIALLFVAYLGRANTTANFVFLLAPAAAALAALARLEVRSPATRKMRLVALRSMLVLSAGAIVPILLVAGGFAALGLLPALAYNTVFGLPQKVDWLVPLSVSSWEMLLFTVCLLTAAWSIRRGIAEATAARRDRTQALVLLVLALAAGCAVIFGVARQEQSWVFSAAALFVAVPFLLVAGGLLAAFERGVAAEDTWLFALYGATAVLYFYPSADPAHVMHSLPAVLPLLAPCLAGTRGQGGAPATNRSAWAVVCVAALIALPFVYLQAIGVVMAQVPRRSFDRASRIEVAGELYRDGTRLVDFLQQEGVRERPLLVLSGKPMVYFLAGRASLVDAYEYELYLVGLGILTGENARDLVNEQALLDAMRTAQPLLVTDSSDQAAERVSTALPRVRAEVEEHYEVLEKLGLFTVLERRSRAPRGVDSSTRSMEP